MLKLAVITFVLLTAQLPSNEARLNEGGIVSLDFCTDQYVLTIVNAAQIAALSPDARSDYAAYAEQAKPFAQRLPRAEILLSMAPDLVVRQWGGEASTLSILERHTIDVVQLDYVTDFDGIKRTLEKLGTAMNRQERAAQEIARINRVLSDLAAKRQNLPRPRALYVTPGGVTAGKGTLIDSILTAAGVVNIAGEAGKTGWPALPAEALIMNPPDLIITGFFDDPLARSNSWSPARHPVFQDMFSRIPTLHLPTELISCAGPASVDAAVWLQNVIASKTYGTSRESDAP